MDNHFLNNLKQISGVEVIGDLNLSKSLIWGVEPSGKFHLGHFSYLLALKKFSERQGLNSKILIADFHATLNGKLRVKQNTDYMLEFFRNYAPKVQRVVYSEQINSEYFKKLMQLSKTLSLRDLHKSLPDDLSEEYEATIRSNQNPKLSPLLYVTMQMLDSNHFNSDLVLAGLDQRRIYMRQRQAYKKTGWLSPTMVFYPLLVLKKTDQKMSKSKSGCIYLDQKFWEDLNSRDQGLKSALEFFLESNPNWAKIIGIIEPSYQCLRSFLLLELNFLRDFKLEL